MNEILTELEEEMIQIIKDYACERNIKAREVLQRMQAMASNGTIEDAVLLKLIGYLGYVHLDENKNPRGYRISKKNTQASSRDH